MCVCVCDLFGECVSPCVPVRALLKFLGVCMYVCVKGGGGQGLSLTHFERERDREGKRAVGLVINAVLIGYVP